MAARQRSAHLPIDTHDHPATRTTSIKAGFMSRLRSAPVSKPPHVVWSLMACLALACAPRDAGTDAGPTPTDEPSGGQFLFTEVVPGIYHARGVGDLVVGSNAAVIVNEDDVLLVDSHISPAAADAKSSSSKKRARSQRSLSHVQRIVPW